MSQTLNCLLLDCVIKPLARLAHTVGLPTKWIGDLQQKTQLRAWADAYGMDLNSLSAFCSQGLTDVDPVALTLGRVLLLRITSGAAVEYDMAVYQAGEPDGVHLFSEVSEDGKELICKAASFTIEDGDYIDEDHALDQPYRGTLEVLSAQP